MCSSVGSVVLVSSLKVWVCSVLLVRIVVVLLKVMCVVG